MNKIFLSSIFILFAVVCFGQQQNAVPAVRIVEPESGSTVYGEQVKITYVVSVAEPVAVRVTVDGRPVQLITDAKIGENTVLVDIPDKDCRVTIVAQNTFGASVPTGVDLIRSAQIFKPSLYVLAIGISNYDNPGLQLQFPAKDASDFTQALIRQAGLLYESVDVKLFTDRSATAENIREGLQWLQSETTSRDVAMLFIAGHGVNNNVGDFFFMPVNADVERINATCVSYTDIKNTVSAVAGKLLVFMDACHSGNVLGSAQIRAAVVSQAVSDLTSADNGPIVFTSSTGRQYSLESPEWNNGAFTKALVEGLTGNAKLPSDNTITVKSLDYYIANRVKELTQGRQAPTTIIPRSVPDFPVAVAMNSPSLPTMPMQNANVDFNRNSGNEPVNSLASEKFLEYDRWSSAWYLDGEKLMGRKNIENVLRENIELQRGINALTMYKTGNRQLIGSYIGLIPAVLMTGFSLGGISNNGFNGSNTLWLINGVVLTVSCYVQNVRSHKSFAKAVEMYNNTSQRNNDISLNFGVTHSGGVGFMLRF